jgi:outer membrane protein insertion porin family
MKSILRPLTHCFGKSRTAAGLGLALLLFFYSTSLLRAQAPRKAKTPPSGTLGSVIVRGSERYTAEEILAATGLQIGVFATNDDFQRAAQTLTQTGVFSEVIYNYSSTPSGLKLEWQVKDAARFVPVYFDNFVWFSDDELRQELGKRIPLFKGSVPLTGNLLDQIGDALQAMLLERKLPGHTDYLRDTEGEGEGPVHSITYSATDVQIVIRKLTFPGAASGDLPRLQKAAQPLEGSDYSRRSLLAFVERNLRPVYFHQGRLQAAFGPPRTQVVASEENSVAIEVELPITPGPVFHVEEIQVSGNKTLHADELASMIHLAAGQVADLTQLQNDLETIRAAYGNRGYLKASGRIEPQLNPNASTVRYVIRLNEGDLYRMDELNIEGLDNASEAVVRNNFTLRKGDPFNTGYLKTFADECLKLLPPGRRWKVAFSQDLDEENKTADVDLRFSSAPL